MGEGKREIKGESRRRERKMEGGRGKGREILGCRGIGRIGGKSEGGSRECRVNE